jgi:ATP-dependent DNA helicase RecQ
MRSSSCQTLLLSEIRDTVEKCFGHRPLKHDKDVISVVATSSGKTLTFWMLLLFMPEGVELVITPLNILGKQNVDSLKNVGIEAITVTAETATEQNFQVCIISLYQTATWEVAIVNEKSDSGSQ